MELKPPSAQLKRDMPTWRPPRCAAARAAAGPRAGRQLHGDAGPVALRAVDAVRRDPDRGRARAVGEHHRHARAQVGQARRRPVAHQRFELAQRATQLVDRQLLDGAQPVLVELALEAGEVAIGLAMALVGVQDLAELGAHGADGVDARLQGADRRLGAGFLGFAGRRADAPGAGAALVRGPPEEERPRDRQRHGVNGLQQAGQRSGHAARSIVRDTGISTAVLAARVSLRSVTSTP